MHLHSDGSCAPDWFEFGILASHNGYLHLSDRQIVMAKHLHLHCLLRHLVVCFHLSLRVLSLWISCSPRYLPSNVKT